MGIYLPGALYLCEYGCGLFFFLIVNGLSKGEIWPDWQTDGAGVYRAVDGQGRRLGFLEWYEEWLGHSLAQFPESDGSA